MSEAVILLSRGEHSNSVESGFELCFITEKSGLHLSVSEACLNLKKSQGFGAWPNFSAPHYVGKTAGALKERLSCAGKSLLICFLPITKISV